MSEKKRDDYNRFCCLTVAFSASPEENEQINIAVSLTGLTKREYIISKLLDRTINVQGNCKVHRAVYDRLTEVLKELQRIQAGEQATLSATRTRIIHPYRIRCREKAPYLEPNRAKIRSKRK